MIERIKYTNDCGDENIKQGEQDFITKDWQDKLKPIADEFNRQEATLVIHTITSGRFTIDVEGGDIELVRSVLQIMGLYSVPQYPHTSG